MGFCVSPVLLAPTVGAWGLLRLGAQKEKRERKRRPGAVLGGREFRAEGHVLTLTSVQGGVQVTGTLASAATGGGGRTTRPPIGGVSSRRV